MYWVEIPSEYLKKDTIHFVSLPEKVFCLVFYEETYVAFSRKCPHAGAPLAEGWCEENYLVCPYHRQKFDLKTGKGLAGQGNYIDIYPTKQEGDKWYIGVKPTFLQKIAGLFLKKL